MIALRIACLLLLPTLVLAQTPATPSPTTPTSPSTPSRYYAPIPAARSLAIIGKGRKLKASIGYAFTSLSMPSSNRVNLSGVDATISADLSPRFGVTADFSYERASNVLNTGQHADVLSYLAGPVYYPTRRGELTIYVHGLAGGARVAGISPTSGDNFLTGYVNKFSWALGGGIEYPISRSIALRIGGDYQRAYFFDSDKMIRGQNNFRAVCTVVYSLSQHRARRH